MDIILNDWLEVGAFFIASYLAGSINFSILLAHVARKGDIRSFGSGNPGAINIFRHLGIQWALSVLLLDIGRGIVCMLIAQYLLSGELQSYVACLGVLGGNLFPVFHGFRGGKGVATSLGIFIALNPFASIIGILLWLGIVLVFRYSSLGSLCMLAYFPLSLGVQRASVDVFIFSIILFAIVLGTHTKNIIRLFRGKELKLAFTSKKKLR